MDFKQGSNMTYFKNVILAGMWRPTAGGERMEVGRRLRLLQRPLGADSCLDQAMTEDTAMTSSG